MVLKRKIIRYFSKVNHINANHRSRRIKSRRECRGTTAANSFIFYQRY